MTAVWSSSSLVPSVVGTPTTTGSENRSTNIHFSVQTECSVQIDFIGLGEMT